MPSPATVRILFVVTLVGTAASQLMLPELIAQITACLDDFYDLVACSRAFHLLADATATARAVGRVFRDTSLSPDDLPGLVTTICRSPEPQIKRLLLREAQDDAVVGLVERMFLARSASEADLATAFSLLVRNIGPVAADAVSGTIVPTVQYDQYLRTCRIRAMIQGLDFTSTTATDLPQPVQARVENFVKTSNPELLMDLPNDACAVPLQYGAPFCGVFPNNLALSDWLLLFRDVVAELASRPLLCILMRGGVRFEAGAYLRAVRVPVAALAQVYPILRKSDDTDWFLAINAMMDNGEDDIIEALFAIGDFSQRLSASPDAERRFLALCASVVKARRYAIFAVLLRHPLMAKVINLRVAESDDDHQGSLLHVAVRLNRRTIVAMLLSFPNLMISGRNVRHHTALHYAWRPRLRRMLLREIYMRHFLFRQELPRLGWHDRLLLDFVF